MAAKVLMRKDGPAGCTISMIQQPGATGVPIVLISGENGQKLDRWVASLVMQKKRVLLVEGPFLSDAITPDEVKKAVAQAASGIRCALQSLFRTAALPAGVKVVGYALGATVAAELAADVRSNFEAGVSVVNAQLVANSGVTRFFDTTNLSSRAVELLHDAGAAFMAPFAAEQPIGLNLGDTAQVETQPSA